MKNIRSYIILICLLGWMPFAATAQDIVQGTVTLNNVEIPAEYTIQAGTHVAFLGSGYNACITQYSQGKVEVPATITVNGNTYQVNAISAMAFRMCTKITEVVLPENVYDIGVFAFQGCQALTKVTLPSTLGSIGSGAFIDLPNLTIIDLKAQTPPYWQYNDVFKFHNGGIDDPDTYTYDMQLLVPEGRVETYRNSLFTDNSLGWTRPDGWGHFDNIDITSSPNAEAYATYKNGVLTFYFDTHRLDRQHNGLTTFGIDPSSYFLGFPGWLDPTNSHADDITTVVFTPLFQYARPTTTANWFRNCHNLETITGINFLRTDAVTDMSSMFYRCTSLDDDDFDLSQFNTASVTNMRNMFYECTGLTSIDLSHFDTRNCKYMQEMFMGCTGLTSIDLSSFETAVCEFANMFSGCTNLESVSLGSLNLGDNVCTEMFMDCNKLSTLTIPTSFNRLNRTFSGCTGITDVYCYKLDPFIGWGQCGDDFNTNTPNSTRFHVLASTLERWVTAYGPESETPANVQFVGDLGTAENPTLIYSTADWDNLEQMIERDFVVNAKMMNDICVTTRLGSLALNQPFKGTFDGNGHTLTVNYQITDDIEDPTYDLFIAPFIVIKNAVIKNLKVDGNINVTAPNGRAYACGLVGFCLTEDNESITITNCRVSTHISGNISRFGGIVAGIQYGYESTTTISGCRFDGTMAASQYWFSGHNNIDAGAILYDSNADLNPHSQVINCLENGSYEYINSKAFAHCNNCSGCYCFNSGLGNNAKLAYSLTTDAEGLILDFGTPTATYDVSGITAFESGMKLDGTYHNAADETFNVTITAPGYSYSPSNLTISGGASISSTDNEHYTVTLAEANAVISLTGMVFTTILLYDDVRDNTNTLNNFIGQTYNVQLVGHTISRNVLWNTLCLPFDLPYLNGTPLQDAELRELDSITYENKVAVFHFKQVNSISADKLYLVKVFNDIESPIFNNVTIKRNLPPGIKKEVGEQTQTGVIVKGNYNKVDIDDFDEDENIYTVFYFDGMTLRPMTYNNQVNAFRGYFEVCQRPDNVVALVIDIESATNSLNILDSRYAYVNDIFIHNGDWNVNANWATGHVPEGYDVLIEGKATVPSGYRASVRDVIIDAGSLTIEDGGQLVHSNEGVTATMKKNITPYTGAKDNFHFIAAPMANAVSVADQTNLTENNYDLYYFDQSSAKEWINYKPDAYNASPGFNLHNGKGYLYANSGAEGSTTFTANLNGTLKPSNEPASINLVYDNSDNVSFKGWNLVGNPFACNANIDRPFYVIEGENVVANTGSTVIAPCTGVMVQAGNANETVTFTKATPDAQACQPNNGSLHIALAEANTRNTERIDNAIVSFNDGERLEKFVFNADNASIFIPQGGKDYAIVNAEKQGEMPLNFKAKENGTYTLSFTTENVDFDYLHLIDNMTGSDSDLLQTPNYTFDARTTDYKSRFKLVFATGNNANDDAFAFYSNGNIIVNGTGTLQVIDMMGRVIRTVGLSQCGSRTTTAGMTPGVYVLRLINGDDVKTQKIVVK